MDVPLAVIADSANASSQGHLNLLGIFDVIIAESFPVLHPAATLVFTLRPRRSEAGEQARVVIRLMDDDSVLAELAGEFIVPEPSDGTMPSINQIFRIAPLGLGHPGSYAFHILVNGEEKATVPFTAIQRSIALPGA
jgi:hypothetical protein